MGPVLAGGGGHVRGSVAAGWVLVCTGRTQAHQHTQPPQRHQPGLDHAPQRAVRSQCIQLKLESAVQCSAVQRLALSPVPSGGPHPTLSINVLQAHCTQDDQHLCDQ